MKTQGKAITYFMGYNTPQGFMSRLDELAEPGGGRRCYIIKGGPGSGKSTMLRRLAEHLQSQGRDVEIIRCSSDIDSLDGIICPSLGVSVLDGTLPHSVEPRYPGAYEYIVDLTSCQNDDALFQKRDEIIGLVKTRSRCHEFCCRYIGAASTLRSDCHRVAAECIESKKLDGYIRRLITRELKPKGGRGTEQVRALSAVTSEGVIAFTDTAKTICKRLYLINDEYGAVSKTLLERIRMAALDAGYRVTSCYCPLDPHSKIEHLFLPESGVGFITSNTFHDFSMEIMPYRIVNCHRFMDGDKLKESRKRLNSNRKAASQMIGHAVRLLGDARETHKKLEDIYIKTIDYDKVEEITQKLIKAM